MRRNETQPIKSVIREYIDAIGHHRKLKEVNIVSSWERLMGKPIANHTTKLFMKNKVLFVYFDSDLLRHELSMRHQSIIDHLNQHAGSVVVEKIIFK